MQVNSLAANVKELNELVVSTTLLKKALEFKRLEHTSIEKVDARFYQGKFTATLEAYAIVQDVTWFDALIALNKMDIGMDQAKL
jgi:hypothetical protein